LTEEWRRQQKHLPTAAQLLGQIKTECEKQAKVTGKKPKSPVKLTEEELAELPALPEGWSWVRMAAISDACLGKMLDADKNKGTPKPYLRNSNVRWDAFDLSDLQEMKFEDAEDERYGVRKGDLIVCEGGEPGRAAIWNDQIPDMKIQKALHRVRFSEFALSKYVLFFLVLSSKNGHLDKYFTGTTIKHLPGEKLAIFPLPLCSVEEQRLTVEEIESRLSVADKIEESITQSLKQAEALRQSILKKAFSGKLVPQDPNDEPAEELLARIRAERAAQEPAKSPARRKGPGRKTITSPPPSSS
jgi:type I restriction enzyme S subunit